MRTHTTFGIAWLNPPTEEGPSPKRLRYLTKLDTFQSILAFYTTIFLTMKKSSDQPGIKVHLEIRSNFRSVLLDFQSFTEKPDFEYLFAHPMILFLPYLVKDSIYRVSVICK